MFVVKIRVENMAPGTLQSSAGGQLQKEGLEGRPGNGCGMLKVIKGTKGTSQKLGEHTGSFHAKRPGLNGL